MSCTGGGSSRVLSTVSILILERELQSIRCQKKQLDEHMQALQPEMKIVTQHGAGEHLMVW